MKEQESHAEAIIYKIHKTVFLLDKISDQLLQTHLNFGFSQFLVMMVLANQPKSSQKTITKSLDQTQAAVSRQVGILVRKKFVTRERNPKAKREYVLSLTELGKKNYKQGVDILNDNLKEIFGIWSKHEKSNMLVGLDKLMSSLRKPER
jgi:DNA-binding MarR family transcriptional regulator